MAKEKQKRSPELVRLYFAAGLVAASYTFFKLYKVLSFSEETVQGVSRWGGLLALGLANTLVIGLIIFIVARALAKVYFERRSGILGSRIRTKLVIAFLAVGIVPSAMLYVMGRPYILKNVERWFSPETARLIQDGGEVSRAFKNEHLARARRDAEAAFRLNQMPQHALSLLELDFCSDSKQTALRDKISAPALPPEFLVGSDPSAAIAIEAGSDGNWYIGRHGAWTSGRLVPRDTMESLARLERRQEEAQQIKGLTSMLVGFTDNVLLFMTLLTIFAAVWTGLTLSKAIAEPVRALAKAAQRVGMGDLNVALSEEGADELAFLSRTFNAMTQELKASNQEIKLNAQRIDMQRAYLNQLLDALPVGVLSISADGQLRTCNNTAQLWLGMDSFDPEEKYFSDLAWLARLGNMPDLLAKARQVGKPVHQELRIGREGEGRPVKVVVVPLSAGGELTVMEDLSLLAQAEKKAAWQEVARRMAHEVKNPLTPIKLTAQRLARREREGRLEPQAVTEGAETILAEVESLARLVDSFTTFAKLPAPQPSQCDACELLRQVYALYASSQEKADFELLLPALFINANWDSDMVKRALINFTDNAVHAIQGGGKISFEASLQGDAVRLSVRDNGSGVPTEIRPHLFEPYFSTKRSGTGLGLAISRKIAEDHGGVAGYEALDQGSLFYLELPAGL
jgi:two-component system nitrogen regulation sensor histidine kinase NtrY